MDDYSTYMAEFPRKISELTNLLNNKEWLKAKELADSMEEDLQIISDIAWSNSKGKF